MHLSNAEVGCSEISATRNEKLNWERHWEHWGYNVGSRVVFLPPSCISLWGRGWVAFLFLAGTPHWVRHRFQRIQMWNMAHKAFSIGRVWEPVSHSAFNVKGQRFTPDWEEYSPECQMGANFERINSRTLLAFLWGCYCNVLHTGPHIIHST